MRIAPLESRSTRNRHALWAALLTAALLVFAPAAQADVGETIILRCTHEESLSGFTQADYRKALKELSADTEEYSACSSQIRQAQTAAAGGHGAAGAAGAGTAAPAAIAATPSEQLSIAHATQSGSGPVRLGNRLIQPGVVHANVASAFSSLPTPLLATVLFLLAGLLLMLGAAARNRVRARRTS
jgi:hypothetical protein